MSLTQTAVDAALQAINRHSRFLILPHANVDPDALSSALACAYLFRAMGKDATVVCEELLPDAFRFLPLVETVARDTKASQEFVVTLSLGEGVEVDKLRYTVEDRRVHIIVAPKRGSIQPEHVSCAEGGTPYDLLVIVDTADLPLLGSIYTRTPHLFSAVPILNIDHHISNTLFGQLHLIDPACASTTEVLYHWVNRVPEWKKFMTPDLATLLLTGLITDTRSFQNPNTSPRSLEVAAALLDAGGRQQEIIQQLYKTKPLSTLKIWGRALSHIQVDPDARIVWSGVGREDCTEMGAGSRETHGILDELLCTIPGADVYVLFTEMEDGGLKASLRTSARIDASLLAARAYGGGGHPRAAGFKVPKGGNFQLQVLSCVQRLSQCLQALRAEDDAEVVTPTPAKVSPAPFPAPQVYSEAVPPQQAISPKVGVDVVAKMQGVPDALKSQDIVQELEGSSNS